MKTAECVSPKHPDKMCDQISDAILDHCLKQDPMSRVAVEVMGGHGEVYVVGEITLNNGNLSSDEIEHIIYRITGKNEELGELDIHINIDEQSPEIARGVDADGAGDQGIMVGYACRDNEEMIPQELYLSRSLCKFIYEKYPYDGKTQITLDDYGKIHTIVVSFQNVKKDDLKNITEDWFITKNKYKDVKPLVNVHINPAGDWNQGGFDADTGLTGRKLAVDNYGPQIPIGGGAFSGKDPSKVDRSGAYMARKIARDILNADEEAKEVTVKLAYAIGVAEPVMATADIEYTNGFCIKSIQGYDLTPKGIIESLELKKPQYEETARWGHFGNGFKWDK